MEPCFVLLLVVLGLEASRTLPKILRRQAENPGHLLLCHFLGPKSLGNQHYYLTLQGRPVFVVGLCPRFFSCMRENLGGTGLELG